MKPRSGGADSAQRGSAGEIELTLPADEGEQAKARAAWYYLVGGLTQQEIADRLGMTRLKVNKLIGQARASGSVRIEIRTPFADCVELEHRVATRYELQECAVVPAVPNNADQ